MEIPFYLNQFLAAEKEVERKAVYMTKLGLPQFPLLRLSQLSLPRWELMMPLCPQKLLAICSPHFIIIFFFCSPVVYPHSFINEINFIYLK